MGSQISFKKTKTKKQNIKGKGMILAGKPADKKFQTLMILFKYQNTEKNERFHKIQLK